MERGAAGDVAPRSPYMSDEDGSGDYAPNSLLEIDVEAALREFASGGVSTTSATAHKHGSGGGADVAFATQQAGDYVTGGQEFGEVPVQGPPWGAPPVADGSTPAAREPDEEDGEVIHIDLTQRPPPLPVSGLRFDQLVTMLPGTTYAVGGSGIPRRSPMQEPRQHSPSGQAAAQSPTSATFRVDGEGHAEGEDAAAVDMDNSQPDALFHQSGGGGAGPGMTGTSGGGGSGGGSPRLAYTFIPGLGLVPIMIAEDEDDEEGDGTDDEDEDGMEIGGFVLEQEDSNDGGGMVGGAAAGAYHYTFHDDDDDDDDLTAVAAAFHPLHDGELDYQQDEEEGDGGDAGLAGAGREPTEVALQGMLANLAAGGMGGMFGGDAGATGARAFGEAEAAVGAAGGFDGAAQQQQLDISEEQLRDIIQQAVHGLNFDGMLLGNQQQEDEEEEDEEERSGSREGGARMGGDEGEGGQLERTWQQRIAPMEEDEDEEAEGGQQQEQQEEEDGNAQELRGAAGDGARAMANDSEGSSPLFVRGLTPGDDDEDMDGLDGGVADGAGGDEPGSILGALATAGFNATARFGATALGVSAPMPAAPAPAAVAAEVGFVAVTPQPHSTAASLNLPRARYSATDPMSPHDAPSPGAFTSPDGASMRPPVYDSTGAAAHPGELPPTRSSEGFDAFPTPFAGSVLDTSSSCGGGASAGDTSGSDAGGSSSSGGGGGGGGGGNLNSTVRMTGQSLAAIRQAALAEEGQRQAKQMAERLGGGADKAAAPKLPGADGSGNHRQHHAPHHHHQTPPPSHVAGVQPSRAGAVHIANPFGAAGHEAAAAAGLIPIEVEATPDRHHHHGHHHHHHHNRRSGGGGRRSGSNSSGGGSSTGYVNVDGARSRGSSQGDTAEEDDDGDLEDLLRDRTIIQPRYPTDQPRAGATAVAPGEQHGRSHGPHQEHRREMGGGVEGEEGGEAEGEEGGGDATSIGDTRRPGHRRSVELVDLNLAGMAASDAVDVALGGLGRTARSRSEDGVLTTPPPIRSLLAMRKSDDGRLFSPVITTSPRLGGNDHHHHHHDDGEGSGGSNSGSSSAHSVADERLGEELDALKEELGQKTTLVAGLRGELRKYTDLAQRLEHQLNDLRGGPAAIAAARSRHRSQSEMGTQGSAGGGAGKAGPVEGQSMDHPMLSSTTPPSTPPPAVAPPPESFGEDAVTPPPPQQPQAQGLDPPARFVLYKDILSQAQLQIGRGGGPSPPDLRDAQELLQNKDRLDAGTEKVMLIKLQKLLAWGCEASWKGAMAAQQVRFMERAAQAAAQARQGWEAEREALQMALLNAGGAVNRDTSAAGGGAGGGGKEAEAEGLREALAASQEEAMVAREHASDLESVVALLNADVVRLRGQLRSSRDGTEHQPPAAARGAPASASDGGGAADSMAWGMERTMLLKTISALQAELTEAQSAAAAADPALATGAVDLARKAALAEKALERVGRLQAERDAAEEESSDLRKRLEDALAATAASASGASMSVRGEAGPTGAQEAERKGGEGEGDHLRQQLAEAREAMRQLAAEAEAEAEANEEQCNMLREQVMELRQELSKRAVDAADPGLWQEDAEAQRAALAAAVAAAAGKDAQIHELRQQLMEEQVELQEARMTMREAAASVHELEEQLRSDRELVAAAHTELEAARQAKAEAQLEAAATRGALEELQARQQQRQLARAASSGGRVESMQAERLRQELETAATAAAHEQTLVEGVAERTQLQQQLASKDAALSDARGAVEVLQAEAAELQALVAELQAVLTAERQRREAAEGRAADLEEHMAQAGGRAVEAGALRAELASLQAEVAHLGGMVEAAEAARDEAEAARAEAEAGMADAEAGMAEAEAARAEMEEALTELRAHAAGLEAEARDLRTALEAEDGVQQQLKGRVEGLESELGAQAALAEVRGDHAAEVEAALAEAEERNAAARSTASRAIPAEAAAAAATAVAEAARAEAKAAVSRTAELEARVRELERQLAEVEQEREGSEGQLAEARQLLADAGHQRERTERQAHEAAAQLAEALRGAAAAAAETEVQTAEDEEQVGRQAAAAAMAEVELVAVTARLDTLGAQLRAVEAERDELRAEAEVLREQLTAATADVQQQRTTAAATPWGVVAPAAAASGVTEAAPGLEQVAALRADKARLLVDCARLQSEVERARATADADGTAATVPAAAASATASAAAASQAKAAARAAELAVQLAATQSELSTMRRQLAAATAELATGGMALSMKGELLAAKDRSMSTLQETVDALKVALQATQQSLQAPAASPRQAPNGTGLRSSIDARSPAAAAAADSAAADDLTDSHLQQYRGTVTALHNKFADSERTIRKLEEQVAALESRLSSGGGSAPHKPTTADTAGQPANGETSASLSSSSRQQQQQAEGAILDLRMRLQDRDAEVARLLRELDATRSQIGASARLAAAHAAANNSAGSAFASSSPTRGSIIAMPGGTSAGALGPLGIGGASAATVHELQMQILQWRGLAEDATSRYQAKKEAVRRLREQLAGEQQRHAEELARGGAQLEAACARLGKLATDMGVALRRCITLDLQPLSATALTASPRPAASDGPSDVNALAALLARQGAALVESLETVLEQAAAAREERTLVAAQLAQRQAVLDELRHQLAKQAGVRPATAAGAGGSDWRLDTASTGGGGGSGRAAAPPAGSPRTPPGAAGGRSPGRAELPTAAMALAQDMAALSAQQAGLRNTLSHFEQFEQRQGSSRAAGSRAAGHGSYGASIAASYPAPGASYPATAVPTWATVRGGHGSSSDAAAAAAAALGRPGVGAGAGGIGHLASPGAFLGLLSGGRHDQINPHQVGTGTGSRYARPVYGQQQAGGSPGTGSGAGGGSVYYDAGFTSLRTSYDTASVVPLMSPTGMHLASSSRAGRSSNGSGNLGAAAFTSTLTGADATVAAAPPYGTTYGSGGSGSSVGYGGSGSGSGLGLSRERWAKLSGQ